ncbi:WD40 repeat domain-containing protein [Candidatus Dependentiae bacterium]
MDNKKNITIFIFIASLLLYKTVKTADIGSDTDVGRFNTQQTLNNGDRIAFFAALDGGFNIHRADATGEFDSTFAVSGEIDLGLGTLSLNQDLLFQNYCKFTNIGNINGNNNNLELSPSIDTIETSDKAVLLTTADQPDTVTTVDWSYDDQFIVMGMDDSSSEHDDLRIYEFDGSRLILRLSQALDQFKEVTSIRWHPSKYYLAVTRKRLTSTRKELLIFEFDSELDTITELSGIEYSKAVYAAEWHPSGDYLAVAKNITSEEIAVYSVNSSGVINPTAVTTINLDPSRSVLIESMDWDKDGQYLAFGTAKKGEEFLVYKFESETLTYNAGVSPDQAINTVAWNKSESLSDYIAMGMNGGTNRLRVYQHNGTAGTLTEKGNSIPSTVVLNINWSPSGEYLAVGKAQAPATQEFEIYTYDSTGQTLTKEDGFDFAGEVDTVRYSRNGRYIAIGTGTQELCVYKARPSKTEAAFYPNVFFHDLHIILKYNLVLEDLYVTMTGNSSINGNGNILTLMPTCTMIIADNATLLLKDVVLHNTHSTRLSCSTNTSTLALENATLVLEDDFIFDSGKLDIIDEFHIIGQDKIFEYKSTTTSFIRENGHLILGNDLTFKYNPSIANNLFINLTDATSKITLNGAILHAAYGLQLTKGMLEIYRNSMLKSDGTTESESIIFGDGSSSLNNLAIKIRPGATAHAAQGKVIDKNV